MVSTRDQFFQADAQFFEWWHISQHSHFFQSDGLGDSTPPGASDFSDVFTKQASTPTADVQCTCKRLMGTR